MKRVLIIAPYFVPRRRVGSLRPYKFAIHLKKYGWEPSVLCIDDSSSELTKNEQEELKDIPIFKLRSPIDRTYKDNKSPKSANEVKKKKNNSFADWIDSNFPVDTWLPFFWAMKGEIKSVIEEVKPDVVWTTSDPWSGGYIAGKIAKKLKLPWVADFRDPWTLCKVRFPKKGFFARNIEKRAEAWMVRKADYMTFTAKKTEKLYLNEYPKLKGRTTTIYNSFQGQPYQSIPAILSKNLEVFFMGSFRELSTASLIIEVLAIVKEKNPEVLKYINIHSYAELSGEDLDAAIEAGVHDRFIVRDKVPFELVQKEIANADILLLSTHPDRKEIVPAKLLDYLVSNRPILSLVQNDEIATILEETGRGVQFSKDRLVEAADLLIKSVEALQKGEKISFSVKTEVKAVIKFSALHTSKQLAELLDEVISNE
ncbi:MAG: hypothetical protein ED557_01985 [Balneola sp.]|nr:MAG: hypothetical protein ED557_01985 [Balneola sp.]